MAVLKCSRCGQEKKASQTRRFYTGEVKEQLKAHACQDCWEEWVKMQIMLINEYRLNLMDPKTDEFLNRQVLAFFNLDEGAEQASVGNVPPEQ